MERWVGLVLVCRHILDPSSNMLFSLRLDELLGLPYMNGKLKMSSFQPKINHSKLVHIAQDIVQIVYRDPVWHIFSNQS
jgi:hypothetical protein